MHSNTFSGWIKVLANGTKILGYDSDVDSGRVSWRKSQLDGIIGATVCESTQHGPITASIFGIGSFWQSDDLIAPMCLNTTVTGIRTARRIEKQILPTDQFIYVRQAPTTLDIYVGGQESNPRKEYSYMRIGINPEQIQQWVVAEIDLVNNQVKWYISKAMI